MIFKFSFIVSGDNFFPKNIIAEIRGDFTVEDFHSPDDQNPYIEEKYNFGSIQFWHPNKFADENHKIEYENAFINFLNNNYNIFIENGADDFEIFMEVYYWGDQCNFEIFNRDLLKRLGAFKTSLPISIYKLKKKEYTDWQKKIDKIWSKDKNFLNYYF